jgi:hypothetical protein
MWHGQAAAGTGAGISITLGTLPFRWNAVIR